MALSKIEWTDYTLNHWNGCTAVAPECDNCYAEARDARFNKGEAKHWGPGAERQRHEPPTRNAARKWNRQEFFECQHCGTRSTGEPYQHGGPQGVIDSGNRCPECKSEDLALVRPRVFAQSLSDTFDNEVPQEWRDELFALAEECTNLDFLFLTKRIGNVRKMVPARWLEPGDWPQHIRIGVTAGTQKAADRDIPQLLALNCPNFVSMEPLLERVDLTRLETKMASGGTAYINALAQQVTIPGRPVPIRTRKRLEWVIVGGESGRVEGIRPMHPEWARLLRDQCAAHDVPFLFKQWGEWTPGENVNLVAGRVRVAWYLDRDWTFDTENLANNDGHKDDQPDVYRIGKERAGRLLDGCTHDGFPGGTQ